MYQVGRILCESRVCRLYGVDLNVLVSVSRVSVGPRPVCSPDWDRLREVSAAHLSQGCLMRHKGVLLERGLSQRLNPF